MPSFQFRLSTLLRLREAWRDERCAHLAEAEQAEQLIADRLAQIDRELTDAARRAFDAARPGTVNVDRLADAARYEMILKVERQSADQQRQAVAAEVEKRRAALVAADRDVRVLEKLHDSQQQRHRDEEDRREAKLLDEVAVMRRRPEEAI